MRNRKTLLLIVAATFSTLLVAVDRSMDRKDAGSRKRALHALNRLTFGPRPGDVDRVVSMGVDRWIDQQLHPERISDSQLEARLSQFKTLKMTPREMVENYPPQPVIRAVAEGRLPMPNDPAKRAVYEAQVERYRNRQEKKGAGQQPGSQENDSQQMDRQRKDRQQSGSVDDRMQGADGSNDRSVSAESLLAMSSDERMKTLVTMDREERRNLLQGMTPEQRQQLAGGITPSQRESLRAMANPQQVVVAEVAQAKLLRAAYSERQMEEVLTDFWFNHFNVFIAKGADRYLVNAYERDVIRPHVLGKFKDMLVATAKSPAMLFYLDNWQSVGPHSLAANRTGAGAFQRRGFQRRGSQRPAFGRRRFPQASPQEMPPQQEAAAQRPPRGLNENYARELMELHTLGVDGGYTQKDVTEVARVFTGWTLRQPRLGGGFDFNDRIHEPGEKIVLGKKIKGGGEAEGMHVLEMLARHPSTAKFISTKLAQRFVSDTPPQSLVDRMAKTYLKSDGDIREVLQTMFRSPEFWEPVAYRAKVKTPLEFLASVIRATGVEVENALPLVQTLNSMGMPLYGAQPPTGYSSSADAWVNSAALLGRMNFALALTSNRIPGVTFASQRLLHSGSGLNDNFQDEDQTLAALEGQLLDGDVSRQTHDTILKQLHDPDQQTSADFAHAGGVPAIAGLILGSPEFQRR